MADPIVGFESARCVRRVCVLSVHTSPLKQSGTGDAGGMNVYIVEIVTRMAPTSKLVTPRRWPDGDRQRLMSG